MDVFNHSRAAKCAAIFFTVLLPVLILFSGTAGATVAHHNAPGAEACCAACSNGQSCSMASCAVTCKAACMSASPQVGTDALVEELRALPLIELALPTVPTEITDLAAQGGRDGGIEIHFFLLRPPQPPAWL